MKFEVSLVGLLCPPESDEPPLNLIAPRSPDAVTMSPVQVKVDAKTSTVGRIVTLVASVAGVSDAVVVVEGAPAGACVIAAAPDAGDLEGVATCARYLASLATAEGEAARLGGVESPEADAEVSEWLTRAVTEYGVAGDPIAEDKLEALDAHLLSRTFVANVSYRATVADLVTYGCVRDAVGALSEDKRTALVNLTRWCDHIGGAYGGDDIFGKLPMRHAEFPDILGVFRAMNTSTVDKKLKERGGAEGPTKQEQRDAKRKGAGTFADIGNDAKKGEGADDKKNADKNAEGKKKEKKEKKEKAPKEPPAKKEVNVSVLDIRVGTIVKCWEHPGADKLWVEEIDVGEDKPRQVVSGLRAFKTSEQMTGARVLCLCNVKKGPLREQMSEGMVMCASNEDHTTVDFVVPPEGAKNGEKVSFAGYEGEPVEVLVPKKKMFEACAPKLRTNADGVACYDGVPFMTSAGPCASSLAEAFIK